ncbi:uncharacterized protein KZ484_025453 [Pholidichthys leucotaenia]
MDPLSPVINSNFTQITERKRQIQVVKAPSLQRIIQVMQRMAQNSCQRVGRLFCLPVNTQLCEKTTCCPAPTFQPKENTDTRASLWSPPSTVLILNISNSVLTDCVIGNDSYSSAAAVTEQQPLMKGSQLHVHGELRCSCSTGHQGATPAFYLPPPSAEPPKPNISIYDSTLSYTIIGSNNCMHVEQPEAEEEPQDLNSCHTKLTQAQ